MQNNEFISDYSDSSENNDNNSENNINFWDDKSNINSNNNTNTEKTNTITNTNTQTDQTRINNELEALGCIYLDEIEKISYSPQGDHEFIIHLKPNQLHSTFIDPICWVKLRIKYNKGYPMIAPGIEILEKYNITKTELFTINDSIDAIANLRSDQNCEMLNDI